MSELTLILFGPPCLAEDGVALYLRSRKCMALLAYLAITRSLHSRARLATLFWPEFDPSHAQAGLRNTLSWLRKALQGAWLVADRETIHLKRSALPAVDVTRFHGLLAGCGTHGHSAHEICSACLPLLDQAVGLYRGDFMAGFSLRDSPEFDEWQSLEAEVLRRELSSALARLAQGHMAQGDVDRGILYAGPWLALDPLHEPAHRCLMRLYAGCGRRSDALRQYAACEALLQEELGVPPDPETAALCEAIKEGQVVPPRIAFVRALEVRPGSILEEQELWKLPQNDVPTTPRHNLPPEMTPFIGREEELDQLDQLLTDPGCRLLTVVGPGGIGKSRLAIRGAENQAQAFDDGVYLVPLASVDSADLLPSTIMEAIGIPRHGSMDSREQLLRVLGRRHLLLVLDNFEHLLEETTLVTEMLAEVPRLKLLVTSRERLNLREEWLLPLGGMDFPDDEMIAGLNKEDSATAWEGVASERSISDLEGYSSIELYVQCAHRIRPGFSLLTAGASSVARICQLVEGMPLAIELAAAWTRVMRCEDIAQEIEGDLEFLATSLRNVPRRHRSMRAVFDQSWKLLSTDEKRVLKNLSVFRGGFRREGAEVVAGASLPLLSALVDESWIRRSSSGRYDMHELIRQYCLGKLEAETTEREESDRARDRHSRYYGVYLEEREESLHGWGQAVTFREILEEMDNVWIAWRWAVMQGDIETMAMFVEMFWFAGTVRGWYHEVSQALSEGTTKLKQRLGCAAFGQAHPTRRQLITVLAAILSEQGRMCLVLGLRRRATLLCQESLRLLRDLAPGRARDRARIRAKLQLGAIARSSGDLDKAKQLIQEGLALAEQTADPWSRERALFMLGITYRNEGHYPEAEECLQQAIAVANDAGEQWWKAACLDSLSYVLCAEGEFQRAETLAAESLRIREELTDRTWIVFSWVRLGEAATALGDYDAADQHFSKGLALADSISDPSVRADCLIGRGTLCFALGQHQEAKELFEESLACSAEVDHFGYWTDSLIGLGHASCGLGEQEQARDYFRQGLRAAMTSGSLPRALSAMVGLAHLSVQEAKAEVAVELLASVLRHPATPQIDRQKAQRLLSRLECELSPAAFASTTARGEVCELQEAVARALK